MDLKHVLASCCALSLLALPSFAEEEGNSISGNVTLASDYSFRGVSQTNLKPAIQGGFDFEAVNGFSVGTWASNVYFGDGTSQELDLYVGYSRSLSDLASMSFSLIQFEYPGEGENYDYQEIHAGLDYASFSLGFVYSPNYVGVDDLKFTYLSAGYSASLSEAVSFDVSLGLNNVDDDEFFAGEGSYMDYSVGIAAPFQGIDLGLSLVGTNQDADLGGEIAETRLILSLGKSL